jgi:hypothetical protein
MATRMMPSKPGTIKTILSSTVYAIEPST